MDGNQGVNFDSVIALPRIGLGIVGIWPNPNPTSTEDFLSMIRFVSAVVVSVLFINAAQTAQLALVWGDFDRITNIISIADLPMGIAVVKIIVLRINKNALRSLVKSMSADWQMPSSKQELDNMIRNAIATRKLSLMSIALGTTTALGFVAIQLYQELKRPPGQPVECRVPLLDAFFPYDMKITPNYQLTWFATCISGVLCVTSYSAIDSFFFVLMLHLCAQLRNLRYRLQRITAQDNELESVNAKTFQGRIVDIVEKHESLYRFADTIETAFNLMFLTQIMFSMIQICLQGYLFVAMISGGNTKIQYLDFLFLIFYTVLVSSLLFMYCYVADKLREESTLVIRAAYDSKWYDISAKEAKLLLPIMCRAQRPIEITAGKFGSLSIELFAKVLKTSGGYLSMLLAVKDRLLTEDE